MHSSILNVMLYVDVGSVSTIQNLTLDASTKHDKKPTLNTRRYILILKPD